MSYLKLLTDADAAMRAAGAGPCMHIRVGFSMAKEIAEKADLADKPVEWSIADSADALLGGWDVFEVFSDTAYFAIQRDDESNLFDSDDEALAYVFRKALSGSDLHTRAIKYVLQQAVTKEKA